MSTYLKHMDGYKQSQLKNKSFAKIQKLFDKAMTRVNIFVDMDTELVRESSKKNEAEMAQESSSKRAGDELEPEKAKKRKIDDDQEEAKLKELMEVISDEKGVAIDAIPLSTKPPSIVDYKIIKEGKISIYQIIRADGSSKRHGYTRPEEGYKRVLWGDLKTLFEHHVEDLGNLQMDLQDQGVIDSGSQAHDRNKSYLINNEENRWSICLLLRNTKRRENHRKRTLSMGSLMV
ncbi:hypothetical protein Tco_0544180 [Tanacetum coccineum]